MLKGRVRLSYFVFLAAFWSLSVSFPATAQTPSLDSIRAVLKTEKSDTGKAALFIALVNDEDFNDPDSMLILCKKALSIIERKNKNSNDAERNSFIRTKASAYHLIAYALQEKNQLKEAKEFLDLALVYATDLGLKADIYNSLGDLQKDNDPRKALAYYKISLKLAEKSKDESQISTALNNLGYVFDNLGNTKEALRFYHRALHISERINDQDNIATQLNNIASIISSNGNIAEALSYYEKALKISEKRNDSTGIALFLVNIGVMYSNLKQADKAMDYYQRGLRIAEKIEDKGRIAHALSRIGSHYYKLGKFSEATANFKYALQISEELKDDESAADVLTYMSEMLIFQKKWKEAMVFANKSLDLAYKLGYPALIENASKNLSLIYEAQGNPIKALSMHRLYVRMRDSVVNAENQKALVRSQLEAEFERKAAADSIVFAKERQITEAQIEKSLAQLKAKRNQQYVLYGGLTLSLIFFGIVFNRFRVTNAQKKIIESQKAVVEEKNKEITDSITYAKRIQNAILPQDALISKHLPDSFILYKPKDIIAGDFYWLCEEHTSVLFCSGRLHRTWCAGRNCFDGMQQQPEPGGT